MAPRRRGSIDPNNDFLQISVDFRPELSRFRRFQITLRYSGVAFWGNDSVRFKSRKAVTFSVNRLDEREIQKTYQQRVLAAVDRDARAALDGAFKTPQGRKVSIQTIEESSDAPWGIKSLQVELFRISFGKIRLK